MCKYNILQSGKLLSYAGSRKWLWAAFGPNCERNISMSMWTGMGPILKPRHSTPSMGRSLRPTKVTRQKLQLEFVALGDRGIGGWVLWGWKLVFRRGLALHGSIVKINQSVLCCFVEFLFCSFVILLHTAIYIRTPVCRGCTTNNNYSFSLR